jgi:hypothetical protein
MNVRQLIALLCVSLQATTIIKVGTVCDGGCDFANSELQEVIDANRATQGDVDLELSAGETYTQAGGFIFKPRSGNGWLRLKSNRLAQLGPTGYRAKPEHVGLMPKLRASDNGTSVYVYPKVYNAVVTGTTFATIRDPNFTTHDLTTNTPVYLKGQDRTSFICTGVNTPYTATGQCASDNVGKFVFRMGAPYYVATGFSVGTQVKVMGQELPAPFVADTRYCIVALDTSNASWHRVQLGATCGGAPIVPTTSGVAVTLRSVILDDERPYYVVNPVISVDGSIQLAETPGGTPVDSGLTGVAVSIQEARVTKNIAFEGLEITTPTQAEIPGSFVFFIAYFGYEAFQPWLDPRGFIIRKSWIHGHKYLHGPNQCVYLNASDVLIEDSTINECHGHAADAQAIAVKTTRGNITVRNNYLSGSGETFITGGSYPRYTYPWPQNFTIERNYFTKPLAWWTRFTGVIEDAGTTIHLKQLQTNQTCPDAAANPQGGQCKFWDSDGTSHLISDDLKLTSISGTGTIYITQTDDGSGLLRATATGTATIGGCGTGFTCTTGTTWPSTDYKLFASNVSAGVVTTVSRQDYDVKNHLEIKNASNVRVEGNFFENAWFTGIASVYQYSHLVFNVHFTSAYGLGEPFNFHVKAADTIVRNNWFKDGVLMLQATGKGYTATQEGDTTPIGKGHRHLVTNNIAENLNYHDWCRGYDAYCQMMFSFSNNVKDVTVEKLTATSVGEVAYFQTSEATAFVDRVNFRNSIFDPVEVPGATDGTGVVLPRFHGAGTVSWLHMQDEFFNINPNGQLNRVILRNWTGSSVNNNTSHYPASPATMLHTGTNARTAIGFTDWAGRNYRLSGSSVYRAGQATAASDGSDLGADQDEVEAEMGPQGADVIAGRPPFRVRSARIITPSTTSATIAYLTNGSACTVKVWSASTYTPATLVIDTNDSGASLSGATKTLTLSPLTTGTQYYGKRWCGTEVDVFRFKTR